MLAVDQPLDDLRQIPIGVKGYVLRPPTLADAPTIEAAISDFEVARMLSRVPHPYPRGAAAGWIEIATARRCNGTALDFVIAGETAVGVVGLSPFGERSDLGYWLAREHHGRGIMSAAVRAAIDAAFERGATTIVSGAFADNPASLRIQEKLGFEIVGESGVYSLSRQQRLRHIDTRLTATRFLKANRR